MELLREVNREEVTVLAHAVAVPRALLLDRNLLDSAKLLWVILQAEANRAENRVTHITIQNAYGLSRKTVSNGIRALTVSGRLSPQGVPGDTAHIPKEVLSDRRLGIHAKLLYGILQFVPSFRNPSGQTTHVTLGQLAGITPRTAKVALGELEETSWVVLSQANKFAPVTYTLRNPTAEHWAGKLEELKLRLTEAEYKGEAIMREYLSLIVDSDDFQDNAKPGFLKNPYTGELLHFDRYYPPGVAFEYNGLQHYGPTERYPSQEEAWKQEARDYIKLGICQRRGISLVTVHRADLSVNTMLARVSGLLPLRNLQGCELLLNYLERVSRAHRNGRT